MKYRISRYTAEESSTRARCLVEDKLFGWGNVIMYRRRKDGLWYDNETFEPLSATIKASLVLLRLKA